MSKFTPTTKRNGACEICGDESGKCRRIDDLHLCMTLLDPQEQVPGYRYLKLTQDQLWAIWAPDEPHTQNPPNQNRERAILRAARLQAEAAHRLTMPAVERDRHYQALLETLSLHPHDQADAVRRGLSAEQIQRWGIKSVTQWQPLESQFPNHLPGVQLDGRSLNTQPGYLCPLRNTQGQIVACQIRLRDASTGRYRWLTSKTRNRPNGATPHYSNGELPLAVFRPLVVERVAIALVEGTGAKPFILSERFNQITVGAAGGLFDSSPQVLKGTVSKLSTELDTQQIELYPDAGAVQNPNVMRRYHSTANLLQSWGFEVAVKWWEQSDKTAPDADELQEVHP